jgi:hypothetical protein
LYLYHPQPPTHQRSAKAASMDFDETRLYYSHQALRSDDANGVAEEDENEDVVQTNAVRRHFREFLRKLTTNAGAV